MSERCKLEIEKDVSTSEASPLWNCSLRAHEGPVNLLRTEAMSLREIHPRLGPLLPWLRGVSAAVEATALLPPIAS